MEHDTTTGTFEDAAQAATETADRSIDAIYQKARVARDKLNTVLGELGTKADQAEQRVRSGVAHTETRIKENPFAAVAIAAGLGVVVGLLLNRRH